MESTAHPTMALSRRAVVLLVLTNALWGGSSLAAKVALYHLPPMTLAFFRFSIAALLLYGLALARHVDLRVAHKDWKMFWAIGAMGLALTYLLTYAGLLRTTAADSALLHASSPVFLTVLSLVLLRERLPWRKVAGVALGLGGVLLVVGHGGAVSHLTQSPLGNALITAGLVCEALSVLAAKTLIARYPPLTVLIYQMLTGAVLLAPFALMESDLAGWHLPENAWSWATFWSVAYLIVPCTLVAYYTWFLLLNRYAASDISIFLYIQPIFGSALGVIFQHDPLTIATVFGGTLVLLAVAIVRRQVPDPEPLPPA